MRIAHVLPILLAGYRAAADDILDVARDEGLDTLVLALEAAGLDHLFDESHWCSNFGWWCNEFTVFAPSEEAFAEMEEVLNRLLDDPDFKPHLVDLLSYHALEGAVTAEDIPDGDVVALNEETIEASKNGDAITLNGNTAVLTADINASNGVVHVVDKVLLPSSSTLNIAAVAEANGLDTLVTLLEQVDLASFVSDTDKLTVFAPTNAAFAALVEDGFNVEDNEAVADLLRYHVVAESVVTEWDMYTDRGDLSTVQNLPISVDVVGWGWHNNLELNGDVGIVQADVLASNGIVHVVDKVLTPPAPPGDIVAVASGSDDFSTLVEALQKAELVETLQGEGPFTVFAPTNSAFQKAGIVVGDLTKEDLIPILLYHVLAGRVLEDDISSGIIRTNPVDQTNLLVQLHGWWHKTIYLNGSTRVTATDVLASNGAIHAIDDVLTPPENIVDLAKGVGDLSALVGYLEDAGLDSVLQGNGPFTVFAPSNDAFGRLGDTGLTEEQLTNLLLYHVVSGNVPSSALEEGEVDTLFVAQEIPQTVEVNFVWSWWSRMTTIKGDLNSEGAALTMKDTLASNGVVHVIDEVLLPNL